MILKSTILRIDRVFSLLFFSPVSVVLKLVGLPIFLKNLFAYRSKHAGQKAHRFSLSLSSLMPVLSERYESAGNIKGHYFLQDLHVARLVRGLGLDHHVDVGSRVDGFIAHLITFMRVTYVDIRDLPMKLENLTFAQGTIEDLPFKDGELQSLSSLHVLEHIGLGRYGDPVDPEGYAKGAKELERVLAAGGTLFLSTPVGKERVYFDAHRVFHPNTILELFPSMELEKFYLIDDVGDRLIEENALELAPECHYGCGIFVLKKK